MVVCGTLAFEHDIVLGMARHVAGAAVGPVCSLFS